VESGMKTSGSAAFPAPCSYGSGNGSAKSWYQFRYSGPGALLVTRSRWLDWFGGIGAAAVPPSRIVG